jgi:nicotinate-nucleotide adenylyltransferase
MKRIGIFGGTFNPIHQGHLLVAQAVLEAFDLDQMLLVPCQVSPFKLGQAQSDAVEAHHRLEMVRLSLAGDERMKVCDIELKRPGVSYTIDTVRDLRKQEPEARFFLVVGMDTLLDLHLFREAEALVELCDVITVQRPGCHECPAPAALHFPEAVTNRLIKNIIRGRWCDISSTEIRQRVAEGRSIRYWVPLAVEEYIQKNRLYR